MPSLWPAGQPPSPAPVRESEPPFVRRFSHSFANRDRDRDCGLCVDCNKCFLLFSLSSSARSASENESASTREPCWLWAQRRGPDNMLHSGEGSGRQLGEYQQRERGYNLAQTELDAIDKLYGADNPWYRDEPTTDDSFNILNICVTFWFDCLVSIFFDQLIE